MIIWEFKTTSGGTYEVMPTPSTFSINAQDLDADSFRSKVSGNLISAVISKSWVSISFNFNYLSESEVADLSSKLLYLPMYVRVKSPVLGNTAQEYLMRCSKKELSMIQDKRTEIDDNVHYRMSFNLIQTNKVTGQ
jgi:hypothetical protein